MDNNTEIWITLLFMVHIWLVVRFCILHTFRQANNRPYHLKWLILVFFLPYLGYALYFWLTRRYVTRQQ
ncbi:hypothetical protein EGT74_01190 [Chitinophaga lutea]|uniref:Uncharacterized protein n=1 Tax=Chitinophaga lutea TaxID=2488634 RepID=A0A3N4Q870_9BACT|nr:PLDc N-terminal domain-containing protein [Chitinophaga lutea]RPE12200.1 hypothetical protein EGT74_01190 [Chitinophaga lutea]